jgi:hypothetical protein
MIISNAYCVFPATDKNILALVLRFGPFLKLDEKPTSALIIQCIAPQYSPTCFGTLKCHHQGIKHDPAEIGAQCRGEQKRMGAVYCNRRRDGRDITE